MKIYHDLQTARIAYAEQNKLMDINEDINFDYLKEVEDSNLTYVNFQCHLKDHPQLGYSPNQSIVIIRGIPGSGKSTYANLIKTDGDVIIDINDRYMVDGVYDYQSKTINDAIREQENIFKKHLLNKDNIILVGCFTKPYQMYYYLKSAIDENADVFIVDLLDEYENIHNVPSITIESIKSNFEKVNKSILKECKCIKSYNYIKNKLERKYN